MLSDLYSTAGYTSGRGPANLLQALIGRNGSGIIPDLGKLHRAFVWENIVFKAGLRAKGLEPAGIPSALGEGLLTTAPESQLSLDGSTPLIANGNASDSTPANGAASPKKDEKQESTPRSLNVKSLSHVLNQVPSTLAPLFQGTSFVLDLVFLSDFDSAQLLSNFSKRGVHRTVRRSSGSWMLLHWSRM
jgi:E3 ubiquitin-protein ligase HUWE1